MPNDVTTKENIMRVNFDKYLDIVDMAITMCCIQSIVRFIIYHLYHLYHIYLSISM